MAVRGEGEKNKSIWQRQQMLQFECIAAFYRRCKSPKRKSSNRICTFHSNTKWINGDTRFLRLYFGRRRVTLDAFFRLRASDCRKTIEMKNYIFRERLKVKCANINCHLHPTLCFKIEKENENWKKNIPEPQSKCKSYKSINQNGKFFFCPVLKCQIFFFITFCSTSWCLAPRTSQSDSYTIRFTLGDRMTVLCICISPATALLCTLFRVEYKRKANKNRQMNEWMDGYKKGDPE